MFKTQKELVNKLYYKGYNPKLILCDMKQNRIVRIVSKNTSIPSPKNGIYIIEFRLEDRRCVKKRSYNTCEVKIMDINFIIDTKKQKINEIELRYKSSNNYGYIRNFSSIDNINYLFNRKILIYYSYIVGILFINHIKKMVEGLSKKYKEK